MDLLARTAELVAIPSVSHDEAALADHVESVLQSQTALDVTRLGANVVGRTRLGRGRRVVLAGHLDTVPANGNAVPRIDGDTLWGLGSADMKGGVAVMLELAAALPDPAVDVTFVVLRGRGGGPGSQWPARYRRRRPGSARGRRRHPGRTHGCPHRGRLPGGPEGGGGAGRGPSPHGAPVDGHQRRAPARTDLDGARGLPGAAAGDRRLRLSRGPSGGGRQRGSGGQRGAGPGHRDAQSSVRAGPHQRLGGSSPASAARAATRPGPRGPAWRRRSPAGGRTFAEPSHPGRPGQEPRAPRHEESWAGPTWPSSRSAAFPPSTSGPGTPSWRTPPASGSTGSNWTRSMPSFSSCCPRRCRADPAALDPAARRRPLTYDGGPSPPCRRGRLRPERTPSATWWRSPGSGRSWCRAAHTP